MKKWKKITMTSALIGLGTISMAATPLVLVSCSSGESLTSSLISLNNSYLTTEASLLSNNVGMMPKFEGSKPDFSELITNSNNAATALKEFKNNNSSNLDTNEIIWLDSYIFQWENKKRNLESGQIYLGANPIQGKKVLSSSSNHISDFVKNALNIYKINDETSDPDPAAGEDAELLKNMVGSIDSAIGAIKDYQKYMDYGMKTYGIQPSTVVKKIYLNQMVDFFYKGELGAMAKGSEATATMEQFVKLSPSSNYFTDINANVQKSTSINESQKKAITPKITELKTTLDQFMVWYATAYYNNADSFGPKNTENLTLSKTAPTPAEVEKTLQAEDKTKIYGLGLTDANLNENNIGIGFMNIKGDFNTEYNTGNKIYQQMLFNNNSINTLATNIYDQGIKLSQQAKDNMVKVADQVSPLVGGFNTIWYDEDGIGPDAPKEVDLSSLSDNFAKFNKWLNQEDFFFGREHLTGQALTDYINKYWTNPTGELANYKNIIISQGYQKPWEGQTTINGEATGTVTGDQALAGAVLSMQGYMDFKKATDAAYNANFNSIPDYVLSPYNYSIREDIGVGMEGPRGSNQFQYNCDPYYSLPKWSVSSLTTHEGKMGHHTQQAYWTQYLQGGDGKNGDGPGYTFINDSFHEGWAVFTEWFANELQMYGTNLDATSRIPTNWLNGNGVIPQYNASELSSLTTKMKELDGGVYYQKVTGDDNSDTKLQNSIKLGNMLQYYGYLNEAQLRNMRLCLDTAYHHKKEVSETDNSALPYGASLKQVRTYMTNTSALSVGDINSESIRYLVMPSQATGYMLGKIIFEDLFKQAEKSLKDNGKLTGNLIDNKAEVRNVFDLFLKNGEIPLEVLKDMVNIKYPTKA